MPKDYDLIITKFIHGDDYTYTYPYSVSLEDTLQAMGDIVKENSSQMSIEAASYGAFSTADGWVVSFLSDQTNGANGTGPTMLEACFNALLKYVENEKERKEEKPEEV